MAKYQDKFEQWIRHKSLLEIKVRLDEEVVFPCRLLKYDLYQNEISVYNEREKRIDRIHMNKVVAINEEQVIH